MTKGLIQRRINGLIIRVSQMAADDGSLIAPAKKVCQENGVFKHLFIPFIIAVLRLNRGFEQIVDIEWNDFNVIT